MRWGSGRSARRRAGVAARLRRGVGTHPAAEEEGDREPEAEEEDERCGAHAPRDWRDLRCEGEQHNARVRAERAVLHGEVHRERVGEVAERRGLADVGHDGPRAGVLERHNGVVLAVRHGGCDNAAGKIRDGHQGHCQHAISGVRRSARHSQWFCAAQGFRKGGAEAATLRCAPCEREPATSSSLTSAIF